MVIRPATGFVSSDSDAQLITDTDTIITSMTNNPHYPSPVPTLATLTTAKQDFAAAVANAANGGTNFTLIKKEKRAKLAALLRELSPYVHIACKGSLVALQSSGFPFWKPSRTPAGVLPAPSTPVLNTGTRTGELVASTSRVSNGYTYNWRVAVQETPATYVQLVQTTAASNLFEGLTPGEVYLVDVNVVGSAGPSDWSDVAALMVV